MRQVGLDGVIRTVAGTGVAGFRGDGGQASAAQLAYPAGLAVSSAGELYIADSQNQRVRKVSASGIITTVLGGSAAPGLLTPTAVAVDASGTIYVGNQSHIVRAYPASGVWRNFAGTGIQGFGGDGGPAVVAQIRGANALAADRAGNVFMPIGCGPAASMSTASLRPWPGMAICTRWETAALLRWRSSSEPPRCHSMPLEICISRMLEPSACAW